MGLLTAIIIIFLAVVAWPLIKIAYKIYRFRKQLNDFYRQATGNAGSGASANQQRSSRPGNSNPFSSRENRRHDRRIAPMVAADAEFEEIAVDREEEIRRQYRTVEYRRRTQVSDAEWEEIG